MTTTDDYSAHIIIDDTTNELGVFELGDGDFSPNGGKHIIRVKLYTARDGMITLSGVMVTRRSSHYQALTALMEQGVSIH